MRVASLALLAALLVAGCMGGSSSGAFVAGTGSGSGKVACDENATLKGSIEGGGARVRITDGDGRALLDQTLSAGEVKRSFVGDAGEWTLHVTGEDGKYALELAC